MNPENENNFPQQGKQDDFRSLLDISPSPTCIVMEKNVIYMNSAGLKLFGAEAAGDIIGKSFLLLFHPDQRDSVEKIVQNNTTGPSAEFELEEKLNRVDGRQIIASLSIKKIKFRSKSAFFLVFHDITEFKNTEDELRTSQEHYRSLLSKLPDYVFIQVNSKIVYVNESMLKFGNYDADEVLNKSVFDFIDEKYHRIIIEGINRRLSGFEGDPVEIEIILKSGERKTVLTKGELIRYENKNALLIVFIDITQRRQAEVQLKNYAEELRKNKELLEEKTEQLIKSESELKKINTSKDKFFSIIAHDLKGPFNGLLGFTSFLANDINTLEEEEISQFASDIHNSAQSIYNLLTNLLEWARVQTESSYCNPSNLHLVSEVTEITKVLRKNIEGKALRFYIDIENDMAVFADRHMLQSIIQNLITNAIKFTDKGGIISLKAARKNGFAEVSVMDTGTGISEDIMNKLFKIDENISTTGTNSEKGTGLGLILCKEFVEKNGGEISVKSIPGKGTTFSFTVPLAEN